MNTFIVWAITFIAGWVCFYIFKKKDRRVFYKTALVMFGIATVVSAYRCVTLLI